MSIVEKGMIIRIKSFAEVGAYTFVHNFYKGVGFPTNCTFNSLAGSFQGVGQMFGYPALKGVVRKLFRAEIKSQLHRRRHNRGQ